MESTTGLCLGLAVVCWTCVLVAAVWALVKVVRTLLDTITQMTQVVAMTKLAGANATDRRAYVAMRTLGEMGARPAPLMAPDLNPNEQPPESPEEDVVLRASFN